MAISAGGKKGAVSSEINVTPLIDVVFVLLIIFLVTMPVKMKQVTLEVPRKLQDNEYVPPDSSKSLTITVKNDLTIIFNNGDTDTPIHATDLATRLQPLLDAKKSEKVVFVDFEDGVQWKDVISIMDTVRSTATERVTENGQTRTNFDEIKVALKLPEPPPGGAPAQ